MSKQPSIACDLSAIEEGALEKHRENSRAVFESVLSIMELPEGYAFELPPETGIIERAGSFIARERLCCPFFTFRLEVKDEGGLAWLNLSGSEEVKSYIEENILPRLDVPVKE